MSYIFGVGDSPRSRELGWLRLALLLGFAGRGVVPLERFHPDPVELGALRDPVAVSRLEFEKEGVWIRLLRDFNYKQVE